MPNWFWVTSFYVYSWSLDNMGVRGTDPHKIENPHIIYSQPSLSVGLTNWGSYSTVLFPIENNLCISGHFAIQTHVQGLTVSQFWRGIMSVLIYCWFTFDRAWNSIKDIWWNKEGKSAYVVFCFKKYCLCIIL